MQEQEIEKKYSSWKYGRVREAVPEGKEQGCACIKPAWADPSHKDTDVGRQLL